MRRLLTIARRAAARQGRGTQSARKSRATPSLAEAQSQALAEAGEAGKVDGLLFQHRQGEQALPAGQQRAKSAHPPSVAVTEPAQQRPTVQAAGLLPCCKA